MFKLGFDVLIARRQKNKKNFHTQASYPIMEAQGKHKVVDLVGVLN